jgi:hypothetical protein
MRPPSVRGRTARHRRARCLVPLQRKDVVGLLVYDLLSNSALAAHRVDGHHCALDGQQLQQGGDGDDLVGLVAHPGLSEHHALARGEGGDDMNGVFRPSSGWRLPPLLLVGAPHRLAVDSDHLGRRFVSAAVIPATSEPVFA